MTACLLAIVGLPWSHIEQQVIAQEAPPGRPNIVFILADDLDTQSVRYMARTQSLIVDQGTSFKNAFVTDSICCPSRASILRGQYPHNHGVLTVDANGGFNAFRGLDRESSTVATWLQGGGYQTVLLGKYFNGYEDTTYIPPGWDEWYGTDGTGKQFNENGNLVNYDPTVNNPTDILGDHATGYIRRASLDPRPFFMYLAPKPPHARATVAARHKDTFPNARAPRVPSFNERDVSDKPSWIRNKRLFTAEDINFIDNRYRERLRTLLALDEMVGRVVTTLEETGELQNTYIFFYSDNGYHMGQHRLLPMKQTAYEEDIRVPLAVRGPDVPAGVSRDQLVINNDLAATFADLAGVPTPGFVDGRSMVPLLGTTTPAAWRKAFLVEKWGSYAMPQTYKALRTLNYSYVEYSNGERELYNLSKDPYQLNNVYKSVGPKTLANLRTRLNNLKGCHDEGCRAAENR